MRLRSTAIALATLAMLAGASPAPAAEGYPPAIAKMVEADVKGCPDGRKAGRIQDGYLTPADFNGDGVDDYVVDNSKSNCFDTSIECGSAGCPASVMMSSGATFKEVEVGHIQGFGIVQNNGRTALRFDLHGSNCDKPGATACWTVMAWNGSDFISSKASTADPAKAATAKIVPPKPVAAAKPRGAQPNPVMPYGEWVALNDGKCMDGGQGIVIEPSKIVVDYGGDLTTFKPTKLEGCTGNVCVYAGPGRKWRVTRLAPDRILFEGPHNQQVSDRSEAQRNRSIPNCSMVHVWP